MSPHCIRLWWLMGLDTKDSWNILGGWDSGYLWRTGMLCQPCWDPTEKQKFERFTSSGKGVRGVRVGWSSIYKKKSRWMTVPQTYLCATGQVFTRVQNAPSRLLWSQIWDTFLFFHLFHLKLDSILIYILILQIFIDYLLCFRWYAIKKIIK